MKKALVLVPILIVILSFGVLSYGINLPYAGQHDWNSVVYGNIARNHLRYGISKTKLGMARNVGYFPQEPLRYFTHYPPLMPLLVAASFSIFGITEWAGRLVPILSSVLMIFFFFKFTDRLWGRTTAVFTSLLLLFSPMLIYYSKIPVHETVVLGFLAMSFWFYSQWLKTGQKREFYLILISLILSQLTSWAGFYLSALFTLHYLLVYKFKVVHKKLNPLPIFLLAPLMFLLHLLHMFLLVGDKLKQDLIDIFLFRTNVSSAAAKFGFTYARFFDRQSRWVVIYFTRIMVLLSFIWLSIFVYRRIKKAKLTIQESLIILLFVFGFTHNLIFQNLAFIHDYMLIYALPFFAVSAAVILGKIYLHAKKAYPSIALLVISVTLILFATERLDYLDALFRSGNNNPAYPLGKAINQISNPKDNILIMSPEFRNFYDVFINFYADRKNETTRTLDFDNIDRYDYVVIPKSHDYVSQQDKQYLYDNFSYVQKGGGIIFNLRNPQ